MYCDRRNNMSVTETVHAADRGFLSHFGRTFIVMFRFFKNIPPIEDRSNFKTP